MERMQIFYWLNSIRQDNTYFVWWRIISMVASYFSGITNNNNQRIYVSNVNPLVVITGYCQPMYTTCGTSYIETASCIWRIFWSVQSLWRYNNKMTAFQAFSEFLSQLFRNSLSSFLSCSGILWVPSSNWHFFLPTTLRFLWSGNLHY